MSDETTRVILELQGKDSGATATVSGIASGVGKLAAQALISAGAVDAMRRALEFSIQSAAEAERVDAQLTAALSSTAGAAGMTKNELESLATELSRVSTYDDEAIKSTEALLLTFTQVGKNVFPEATQAILDMSTAMGQDLKTSTIQIGKALNDPIAGLTALRRVGVSFTEDQKEMIKTLVKTGDVLGAQQIILDELSREFGGSATAAANTYEGQLAQLRNEVGNLGEAFGEGLLPDIIAFTKEAKQSVMWVTENYEALKEWTYWATHLQNPLLFISDELRVNGTGWRDVTEEVSRYNPVAEETNKITEEQAKRINDASIARWEGIASIHEETKATDDLILSEEELEAAIKAVSETNEDLINNAIKITDANADYQKSQEDITAKIAELQAEKLTYYSWETDKIQETQDKIDELSAKYSENAEEFRAAMEEKFAMMAVEKIAMQDGIDGFSEAEYERARAILETTDVATAAAFEQAQAQEILTSAVANGQISVEQFGSILSQVMEDGVVSVDEVKAAIEGLPSEKTITLNIQTNYSAETQAAMELFAAGEKGYSASPTKKQHAAGGSFLIPMGYGNEGFAMGNGDTASGGERVTITPQGQSPNADIVAAIYATQIDEAKFARLIVEGILKETR